MYNVCFIVKFTAKRSLVGPASSLKGFYTTIFIRPTFERRSL